MPRLVAGPPSHAAPSTYKLAPSEAFIPESVTATFDGTSAGGTFLPTLSIYSQDGKLIARSPASEVAAGSSAEVTFAPLLRAATAAAASASITKIYDDLLGASGYFDFDPVPQTYTHLWGFLLGRLPGGTNYQEMGWNGDSSLDYNAVILDANDSSGVVEINFPTNDGNIVAPMQGATAPVKPAIEAGVASIWIPYYRETTFEKYAISLGGAPNTLNAPSITAAFSRRKVTDAITRILIADNMLTPGATSFLPGSHLTWYGVP